MLKIKIQEEYKDFLGPLYEKASQEMNSENAGFDLFCPEDMLIMTETVCHKCPLGISAMVVGEDGELEHFMMVPRSSITKQPLVMGNSPAIIDSGYRGIIEARFHNVSDSVNVKIEKGQRLVQLIRGGLKGWIGVELVDELPESGRGSGGFGSTGK